MEKAQKHWHPRLTKPNLSIFAPSTNKPMPLSPHSLSINNHMHCKEVTISAQQLEYEHRINKWRYETDYPILRIYHFSYDGDSGYGTLPKSNPLLLAKIVYEVPHTLLASVPRPLPLAQCLYLLKSILIAVEKLLEQFGYFHLSDRMIGLTEEGYCKVWVNEEFWRNGVAVRVDSEEECVEGVKGIVRGFVDVEDGKERKGKGLEKEFVSFLGSGKCKIVKMLQKIWEFSYQNSILVPPYLHIEKKQLEKPLIPHNLTARQSIQPKQRYNSPSTVKLTHKKTQSNLPSPSYRNRQQKQESMDKFRHRQSQKYSHVRTQPPEMLDKYNENEKDNNSNQFNFSNSPNSSSREPSTNLTPKYINSNSSYVKISKFTKKINPKPQYHQPQIDTERQTHRQTNSKFSYRLSQASQFRWTEYKTRNFQQSPTTYNYSTVNPSNLGKNSRVGVINFHKNLGFYDNNSTIQNGNVSGGQTDRERDGLGKRKENSKSDFIERNYSCMNDKDRRISDCSLQRGKQLSRYEEKQDKLSDQRSTQQKENTLTSNQSQLLPFPLIQILQPNQHQNLQASQQSTIKIKALIKQKIRINRQKKKVVKLQAINTVKSIGEFTESEKRILEENHNIENGSMHMNINLEILQKMCRKTGTSYFHIDVPKDSDEEEEEECSQ